MIGWIAQMHDGSLLHERNGVRWHEIDIHGIEKLWLESFERYTLERIRFPRLLEFVQFKSACIHGSGEAVFESQCIGWTDGIHEMVYRMIPDSSRVEVEIHPRTHFHPLSIRIPAGMANNV